MTSFEGIGPVVVANNLSVFGEGFSTDALVDVSALTNIQRIQGNLVLTDNSNLADCCVLPSLQDKVGGEIVLVNNAPACSSLEAIAENCDEPVTEIDCSQETVILTTQAEVDAFDCTSVNSLTISLNDQIGDPIADLNHLSTLTEITNNFTLQQEGRASSINLSGLNNLKTIGGNLSVFGNSISDFEGLSSLTSIDGVLQLSNIGSRDNALSFEGLSALVSVGGILFADSSFANDFTGLESLKIIRGDINATNTDKGVIGDFTGLENVEEITGSISFAFQQGVKDFQGLKNLRRVGGSIIIVAGDLKSFAGLERLVEIGGYLISFSNDVRSVRGLQSLRSAGSISLEEPLASLDGLQQLRRITDDDLSFKNTLITDVSPLKDVEAVVGKFILQGNSKLSDCCIIPSLLERVQGEVIIENNAPECSSLEAIEENCAEETAAENGRTAQELHAFPNPSENFVQIRVDQPTTVQLFNTAGYLVKEQRIEQEGTIDLTTVSPGVYLLKAPGRKVQRIIKK